MPKRRWEFFQWEPRFQEIKAHFKIQLQQMLEIFFSHHKKKANILLKNSFRCSSQGKSLLHIGVCSIFPVKYHHSCPNDEEQSSSSLVYHCSNPKNDKAKGLFILGYSVEILKKILKKSPLLSVSKGSPLWKRFMRDFSNLFRVKISLFSIFQEKWDF